MRLDAKLIPNEIYARLIPNEIYAKLIPTETYAKLISNEIPITVIDPICDSYLLIPNEIPP